MSAELLPTILPKSTAVVGTDYSSLPLHILVSYRVTFFFQPYYPVTGPHLSACQARMDLYFCIVFHLPSRHLINTNIPQITALFRSLQISLEDWVQEVSDCSVGRGPAHTAQPPPTASAYLCPSYSRHCIPLLRAATICGRLVSIASEIIMHLWTGDRQRVI